MDKTLKRHFLLIAFGVALYACLMNLGSVLGFLKGVGGIITPVVMALFIAFIFNVPMTGVGNLLRKLWRHKEPKEAVINTLSLVITFVIVVGVITLVTTIVVPQFVASVGVIVKVAEKKIPEWLAILEQQGILDELIRKYSANFSMDNIVKMLGQGSKGLSSIAEYASNAVSAMATFSIALILCIYVLIGKKTLGMQTKHVMYAFIPTKWVEKILNVATLTQETFSKFIKGQCLEACILGTMIFVGFTIARLPYAAVAGVITALFAFVPYIGAFISLAIMVVLIAMTSPVQAIIALIVYQVVQFIENHFVYPNVVGNSVGLPALWTLIAVVVGGKLFGVLGMVFFIPVVSVIYTLIRQRVRINLKKLKEKGGNLSLEYPEILKEEKPEKHSEAAEGGTENDSISG